MRACCLSPGGGPRNLRPNRLNAADAAATATAAAPVRDGKSFWALKETITLVRWSLDWSEAAAMRPG